MLKFTLNYLKKKKLSQTNLKRDKEKINILKVKFLRKEYFLPNLKNYIFIFSI
jgi:hypothetical protein